MKRSEIYREAARRIESGESAGPSCNVIKTVAGNDESSLEYGELFSPNNRNCLAWSWQWVEDDPDDGNDTAYPFIVDCRILALCFMAAIAEDDE